MVDWLTKEEFERIARFIDWLAKFDMGIYKLDKENMDTHLVADTPGLINRYLAMSKYYDENKG